MLTTLRVISTSVLADFDTAVWRHALECEQKWLRQMDAERRKARGIGVALIRDRTLSNLIWKSPCLSWKGPPAATKRNERGGTVYNPKHLKKYIRRTYKLVQ